jgi:hypothetical protein
MTANSPDRPKLDPSNHPSQQVSKMIHRVCHKRRTFAIALGILLIGLSGCAKTKPVNSVNVDELLKSFAGRERASHARRAGVQHTFTEAAARSAPRVHPFKTVAVSLDDRLWQTFAVLSRSAAYCARKPA